MAINVEANRLKKMERLSGLATEAEARVWAKIIDGNPRLELVLNDAATLARRLYNLCRDNKTGTLGFGGRAGKVTFVPLRKEKPQV